MKKLLSVIALTIAVLNLISCQLNSRSTRENVSFYKVPLVCGAAPEIGCGSRAKPALLELERNPAVQEAWLNRPGTMLAIVWKGSEQTKEVAKPILDSNSISFEELSDNEARGYQATFRKPNAWFRGADVDELSREEAETIANSSVKLALEKGIITQPEADSIKKNVTAYFKEELVKIRTNDQLNFDSDHKFREDLTKIGEKFIGADRTQRAMALYEESMQDACKKDKACNAPGAKKCCDEN